MSNYHELPIILITSRHGRRTSSTPAIAIAMAFMMQLVALQSLFDKIYGI